MQLTSEDADIYSPDGAAHEDALASARGGALAIGAHQDDLEIFAIHGIGSCLDLTEKRFTGVTVTDGAGSARKGAFADFTNERMAAARLKEQREAAKLGRYALQIQLGYESGAIKDPSSPEFLALVEDLTTILKEIQPKTLYLHNPFDKHASHNAVTAASLAALQALVRDDETFEAPARVYGCEVWRGLDWLPEDYRITLDVSDYLDLQARLIDCHASQIEGSKNYTQATLGREMANATYGESHALDDAKAVTLAVDLSEFSRAPCLTWAEFANEVLQDFSNDLMSVARKYTGNPEP
ncbi:MAG: PIG-L deacetylase family protein [Pseudobdellovibrionaceae bacterium]